MVYRRDLGKGAQASSLVRSTRLGPWHAATRGGTRGGARAHARQLSTGQPRDDFRREAFYEQVRRPVEVAHTLPPSMYTSEAVFRAEDEAIFGRAGLARARVANLGYSALVFDT